MIKQAKVSRKEFSCYTFLEAETAGGQLVSVSYESDIIKKEGIKEKIKEVFSYIKDIKIPKTHKVNLSHGGFGRYSRYDIFQHKYAGGMGGYYEALEIKEPPDGRCGFVLYVYMSQNYNDYFLEFKDKETLLKAWNKKWSDDEVKKIKGFIRKVECGGMEPWFYAIGDEHLTGDFVFPSVFFEHPVYKPMRKFIVRDYYGHPSIKTCMGSVSWEDDYGSGNKHEIIRVFWDDGTVWEGNDCFPELLKDEQLWICEAIEEFEKILSGGKLKFEIPFTDGTKFIGRMKFKDRASKNIPGKYNLKVTAKKNGKVGLYKGSINFKPSYDYPTIESRIYHDAETKKIKIVSIDSCIRNKNDRYNGKWQGVYEWEKTDGKIFEGRVI